MGDARWAAGTTVNVSVSGVRFEGDELLPCAAAIELDLVLPDETTQGAHVVAHGVVVRTSASARGTRQDIAATIAGYGLVRNGRSP
jgi:hypothetical protein